MSSTPSSPAGSGKGWIFVAVGLGTFMSALDTSIVNTILPLITRALGSPLASTQWVVTTYLLVVSGFLLAFGRLGDLGGHKRLCLLGFAAFASGSALCALAGSVWGLVTSRALQALGAALLFANGPAILTRNFPPAQRGRILGLQATMTYLGLTLGPSLGGWLASAFGWRAVFSLNVPLGLAALVLGWRVIPADIPARRGEGFDAPGAALFIVGLVALLLGLNRGSAWGWGSAAVIGLILAAMALLALFVLWERRAASPLLDLGLFRRRLFSAALASAVMNYICTYTITFFLPFYLIQGRGLDSAQAGMILTAQPLVMALIAPISGALSDRIGSRLLATLGMLVLMVGLLALSRLGGKTPLPVVTALLVVTGLGIGLFTSPNTSTLMGAAPRQRQGVTAGILATARNTGMVLGVGLAGAIYNTLLAHQPPQAATLAAVPMVYGIAAVIALLAALTSAVRGDEAVEPSTTP
jgi:EmrB/QacA subfamily drug resistance transporter